MRLTHLLLGLSYPCTIEIRIELPKYHDMVYVGELEGETKIKYTWAKINTLMDLIGNLKVLEFWENNELDYKITVEDNLM